MAYLFPAALNPLPTILSYFSPGPPLPSYPQLRSAAALCAATEDRMVCFSELVRQTIHDATPPLSSDTVKRLRAAEKLCRHHLFVRRMPGAEEMLEWAWAKEEGQRLGAEETQSVLAAYEYWIDREAREAEWSWLPAKGVGAEAMLKALDERGGKQPEGKKQDRADEIKLG